MAPGRARHTLAWLQEQQSWILAAVMSEESTTPDLVDIARRAVEATNHGQQGAHIFDIADGTVARFVLYFEHRRALADLGLGE